MNGAERLEMSVCAPHQATWFRHGTGNEGEVLDRSVALSWGSHTEVACVGHRQHMDKVHMTQVPVCTVICTRPLRKFFRCFCLE